MAKLKRGSSESAPNLSLSGLIPEEIDEKDEYLDKS